MSVSRQNKTAIMNSLENSLFELMKEKPFNDFCIRELCERAGVGRSSFYRYYSTKEDVLISLLLHSWYAWRSAEGGANDYTIISHESARSFIRHVFATKDLFELIHRNGLDHLFPIIMERNENGKKAKRHYKVAFFCYGVFGVLRDWWMGGCKESAEELIRVLDDVCPNLDE